MFSSHYPHPPLPPIVNSNKKTCVLLSKLTEPLFNQLLQMGYSYLIDPKHKFFHHLSQDDDLLFYMQLNAMNFYNCNFSSNLYHFLTEKEKIGDPLAFRMTTAAQEVLSNILLWGALEIPSSLKYENPIHFGDIITHFLKTYRGERRITLALALYDDMLKFHFTYEGKPFLWNDAIESHPLKPFKGLSLIKELSDNIHEKSSNSIDIFFKK